MLNDPRLNPPRKHPLEAPRSAINQHVVGEAQVTTAEAPPENETSIRLPPAYAFRFPTQVPYATYVLVAINVLIFALMALSPNLSFQAQDWGANNQVLVFRDGEVWRLFTSMFLHAPIHDFFGRVALGNSAHILFNMFILYALGRQIECLFGRNRFLLIYILGGLGASLLSAFLGAPNSISVGASGAIFAVIGAEFAFYLSHRGLLGRTAEQRIRQLNVWLIINITFGFLTQFSNGLQTDNWAHIGGAVCGFVLALMIAPRLALQPEPDPLHPHFTQLADQRTPQAIRNGVIAMSLGLVAFLIFGAIVR
jgi:rhomboid protease GluP